MSRLYWRTVSLWAQVSQCNAYSITIAGAEQETRQLIVTAWDQTRKPAQHLESWPVATRNDGWQSAKAFCQQHAQQGIKARRSA